MMTEVPNCLFILLQYGDSRDFLWRLARAYKDMYESVKDKQEKSSYAQKGGSIQTLTHSHCHPDILAPDQLQHQASYGSGSKLRLNESFPGLCSLNVWMLSREQ